ncbi:MAG: endonuclease, partial [Psychroserpens sp.]|nr:endonuclease [Psychroserpens sp.]
TKVDSTRHAYSDAHALRAADAQENSRRSNRHYGTVYNSDFYNGPANVDPLNNIGISFRGDVARSVLFLELRYNNLQVINGSPSSTGNLGDLATLLQWHEDDPPDDFEMNRNNIVYQWQQNRNPLIDLPELVDFVWGSQAGETFTLSNSAFELSEIRMYPNPTQDIVYFSGVSQFTEVEVYSIDGKKINDLVVDSNNKANLDLTSGVYLVKITDGSQSQTKRLVIN